MKLAFPVQVCTG